MKLMLAGILSASAVTALGSGAITTQQPTRPGEISPANVWIRNRAPNEAVPVSLIDVSGPPLRVQVMGPVQGIEQPVATHPVRQAWEYNHLRISSNADVNAVLNQAGAEGWEAVQMLDGGGGSLAVLLKRPRAVSR